MTRPTWRLSTPAALALLAAAVGLSTFGCSEGEQKEARKSEPVLRDIPAIFRGTIASEASLRGIDPVLVSGLGLVVGLNGTGGGPLPPDVMSTMERQLGRGGVGKGGILEGEPRRELSAWNTYQKWIMDKSMECSAKVKPGGKGYILEWAISFDPCLEVEPGVFYSPKLGDRKMGLNIALGDIDQPERGEGNFANFHHEDWFAGTPKGRTRLKEFGTLWIRTSSFNKKNARP